VKKIVPSLTLVVVGALIFLMIWTDRSSTDKVGGRDGREVSSVDTNTAGDQLEFDQTVVLSGEEEVGAAVAPEVRPVGTDPYGPEDDDRLIREVVALRRYYPDFLQNHNLSEAEVEQLFWTNAKRTVLASKVAQMKSDGFFDEPEDVNSFYKEIMSRYNQEVRDIAGDDFSLFKKDTDKIPFRKELNYFSILANNRGYSISEQDVEDLAELYLEGMKSQEVNIYFNPLIHKIESDREFLDQMRRRRAAYDLSNEVASGFLSSEELEYLEKFQKDQIFTLFSKSRLPGKTGG